MITRPQAVAAADLCRTITTRWDANATTKIILEACETRPFREVLWAAITQASNPTNTSPNSILFGGDHWPTLCDGAGERKRRQDRDEQTAAHAESRHCPHCDETGTLPSGARCPHDGRTADERAQLAKERANRARAEIRPGPARQDLPPEARAAADSRIQEPQPA